MRNKLAKYIKRRVLVNTFGIELDARQIEHAMQDKDFKSMYRAAKKNYNRAKRLKNQAKSTISKRQLRLTALNHK